MKAELRYCRHCRKKTETVRNGYVTEKRRPRFKCKNCGKTWSESPKPLPKESDAKRREYKVRLMHQAGATIYQTRRLLACLSTDVMAILKEKAEIDSKKSHRHMCYVRPIKIELKNQHREVKIKKKDVELVIIVTKGDTLVAAPRKRPSRVPQDKKQDGLSWEEIENGQSDESKDPTLTILFK